MTPSSQRLPEFVLDHRVLEHWETAHRADDPHVGAEDHHLLVELTHDEAVR